MATCATARSRLASTRCSSSRSTRRGIFIPKWSTYSRSSTIGGQAPSARRDRAVWMGCSTAFATSSAGAASFRLDVAAHPRGRRTPSQ